MENVNVFHQVYKHRVNASGEVSISLCVTLDNKPVLNIPLHKKVKLSDWDEKKRVSRTNKVLNVLLDKNRNDLMQELTKAQLLGIKLTKKRIKEIANGEEPGKDFIAYCRKRIPERYPKDSQKETRRSYLGEVSKLQDFQKDISFGDIDTHFLSRYKAWMINVRKNTDNTIWKAFKFMNTMFNDAKEAGYVKENPFENYNRGVYKQGKRDYLDISDCDRIHQLLQTDIPERLRLVGIYYLFMCYTGFRFQDATKFFNYDCHVIDNERIVFDTQKSDTEVNIKIHKRLRTVLDYIKNHSLSISNKEFNSYTKVLATMAGINIKMTAHTGRHTFGATMAELDVPIERAQKLLGHKDRRSTSIYYHIKNKSLDIEMDKWDRL